MSNDRVPAIRPQTHLLFRADTRILDEGSPPWPASCAGPSTPTAAADGAGRPYMPTVISAGG
jgi:hypothetical protein